MDGTGSGVSGRWGDPPADGGADDSSGESAGGGRSGPRGWVVLTITAVVVLALVAGGFAIDRFVLDDDTTQVVEAVATTVDEEIDVEPVAVSATRLFTRTTESGVEIRVNESDDAMMFGPGFEMEGVPDWCVAASSVSAMALTADAVSQAQLPRSKAAPPTPAVAFGLGGIIEEAPLALVVVQVDDTVTRARLTHPSGAIDTMEPVDGLVALAVAVPIPEQEDQNGLPMFDPWSGVASQLAVEVLHRNGDAERLTNQDLMNGIPMWSDPECMGSVEGTMPMPEVPDLELPRPGAEQPLDPAAERTRVEAAFVALYSDIGDKDTLFRYVDDASGLDLAMVGIMREYGEAYRSMEPEILEMVFFSPIEASFVYTTGLDPFGDGFTGQLQSFGRARLVDGEWRITRSTVCQDMERIGVQCTI